MLMSMNKPCTLILSSKKKMYDMLTLVAILFFIKISSRDESAIRMSN